IYEALAGASDMDDDELRTYFRTEVERRMRSDMSWKARDITEPSRPSTFDLDLQKLGLKDVPPVGDLLGIGTMVYEVMTVDRDEGIIEVRRRAGPGTAGARPAPPPPRALPKPHPDPTPPANTPTHRT